MKFEASDKVYLDERRQLSEKYGPRELWSVIDHWPLYAGIANIGRFMAIADAFRSTLDVPGNVAEFGSWRGANIMFLAKLLHVYDPNGCKTVHCFESFEGLESFTDEDGSAESSRGTYQGSYEELADLINLYRLQDDIVIHKGLIQETLPQVLSKKSPLTFSFIYCAKISNNFCLSYLGYCGWELSFKLLLPFRKSYIKKLACTQTHRCRLIFILFLMNT